MPGPHVGALNVHLAPASTVKRLSGSFLWALELSFKQAVAAFAATSHLDLSPDVADEPALVPDSNPQTTAHGPFHGFPCIHNSVISSLRL